ncbi:sugar phosphate nucleotidyltransferase [Streptomyces hydrogenans]|uniref:sugar phosphate nucleotidyltransferase n=1 Tax=Streptomyces hydrogenans TaxID=1873719 RepID=UPI003813AA0F
MTMKALVTAGHSSRGLRPVTAGTPTQLVPLANEPLLHHSLREIAAAGITDVGVVTGPDGGAVHRSLGDGHRFGVRITYLHQPMRRGLAHAVIDARGWLGDDDFLLHPGHTVSHGALPALVEDFRAGRADALVMVDAGGDGPVDLDALSRLGSMEPGPPGAAPRVLDPAEGPGGPGAGTMTGLCVFTPAVHQAVSALRPSWRRTLEFTDALLWLGEHGYEVRGHTARGYCGDASRPEGLLACNRYLLSGRRTLIEGTVDEATHISGPVVVAPGADVTRCRITGPVVIGHNAVVADSVIGPDVSIGPDCVVQDASVHGTVLFDGAWVSGVHGLRDSVIGRDARVVRRPERTDGHQLVLGDRATARLSA